MTIEIRQIESRFIGTTFEVVEDGAVIVRTHGAIDSRAFPSIATAAVAAATLAGILRGMPMPPGWTVQRTPAGFFVRDKKLKIVGGRHAGDFPGDTATVADCLRLADRFDTPVRGNQ